MKATDNLPVAAQRGSCRPGQLAYSFVIRALACIFLAAVFAMSSVTSYGQACSLTVEDIVGPADLCALANSAAVVSYSVKAANASGFNWTVPTQAVFVSGQGTATILIRYKRGFISGSVSVEVRSACDTSSITRTLTVTKMLNVPEAVEGPAVVCQQAASGEIVTYTVAAVPNATQYIWTLSARMVLIGGQGTNTIQVQYLPNFKSGYVKVKSVAACARSANFAYAVTAKEPGMPGTITGPVNGICSPNHIAQYSIMPIAFATGYDWSVDVPGATVESDGTKATITFPAFVSGTVRVSAVGVCGTSAPKRLTVSSKGVDPVTINGPDSVCAGSVQTFSVDPVPSATFYTWTLPAGSVITEGEGTASITVLVGEQSGSVGVTVSTGCDTGNPVFLELVVEECTVEPPPVQVDVYPIPTSGILHLKFQAKAKGQYQIMITHANSACTVFTKGGCHESGWNEICMDLSGLRDGSYIFYVTTGEFKHQERIEIKH